MAAKSEDAFLNGRLRLRQGVKGYRAGMDAALLAAACDAGPRARVLEAGCGVGGVLLAAAMRRPKAHFVGVERDPAALALAAENIALNALTARVSVNGGDISAGPKLAGFDVALANPPYFDDEKTLRGPAPAKRGAWIADDGLAAWIRFLTAALRDGGSAILIHRAERLGDLLALFSSKAGSFQIRPVHPFADAPAGRVLLKAVKGGRAPLRLLPPLILHPRTGAKHTPEAEAILRGEVDLPWV